MIDSRCKPVELHVYSLYISIHQELLLLSNFPICSVSGQNFETPGKILDCIPTFLKQEYIIM